MRRFVTVAILGLSMAGGACRQSPTPSATAGAGSAKSPAAVPASVSEKDLITAADVGRVLGVAGIEVVPRGSKPGAGGDVNFALPGGDLVLMVTFSDMRSFDRAREQYRVKDIPGVGDAAFWGPPGDLQYILAFRKRDRAVSINTFLGGQADTLGKVMMSEEQLTQVARLIAGRM